MSRANVLAGLAIAALMALGCRDGTSGDKSAAGTGKDPSADRSMPAGLGFKPATEAELGVPVYPGSTPNGTEADPMKKIGSGHSITMSDRVTGDPVDKVVSFYKAKAPALQQSKLDDGVVLTGTAVAGNGDDVVVSVKPSGGHTEITISNTR